MQCSETALCITVRNDSGQSITIDGNGFALIEQIDLWYGSSHLSSIAQYDLFAQIINDYTGGVGYHYAKGNADIAAGVTVDVGATFNQANINNSINTALTNSFLNLSQRNGRVIPAGASDTFVLPIMNLIGSMAMKCLPIGELRDSIKIEIKTTPALDWGVYAANPSSAMTLTDVRLWLTTIQLDGNTHAALSKQLNGKFHVPVFDVESFRTSIQANTGSFSYHIPVRVSSLVTVLVALRENAVFNAFNQRSLSRTKSTLNDYRFRLGSQTLPATQIICSGSGAEARMELMRAFNQLSLPTSDTFVNNALYNLGGASALPAGSGGCFVFALNLSALGSADILSDGRNTRMEQLVLDLRFVGNNVALQMDVFAIHEKVIVIEQNVATYRN